MITEKEAFAEILARAKQLVMESFEFDKAFSIMRAVSFGWAKNDFLGGGIEGGDYARRALEDLIDHAIETALDLLEDGKPWGSCWTSSAGFIVFVFDSGIIQAHMSLVNSDSYDYDELLPLYEQLDIARGNSLQPRDSCEYGGKQRRILMLNE